jgi:guanine nucleotide-binding protein subunit alpha
VTVVIFCASLSEYDQNLREDSTTNRMKESLLLFDAIVNSPWFRKTPVVLFLNKIDLFKEKIVRVPLNVCFTNYTGQNEVEEAKEYIRQRFIELPGDKAKAIYVHFTCAINTENVEVVFRVVKETLLREILNNFVV